jgi:crotonobetainyl-CoA:carnitine CoA-transferase CaiB-like acyl-CoA transferase
LAPLTGIRVLDLTRLLPGPYATLVLADLGADVVKVEDPSLGDYLRNMPPVTDGGGALFAAINRGKRSLSLDLKAPGAPALLQRLARAADVLVEGFRPGVLARFGCSPDELCAINPRLVVCSITGYGQTGPLRDRAGHDVGYLALGGVLARFAAGQQLTVPGVQIADVFGGGMTAVAGILAALVERARTGRGRAVDVSMTEGAMALLAPHFGGLAAGQSPESGDVLSGVMPCYRVYRCKDGRSLSVGALEVKFWQRFCAVLGRPDLEPRAFDRDPQLLRELDALFATRPRDEWAALFAPADCCVEPVLEIDEVLSHPQHAARDLTLESGGLRLVRSQPALVPTAELPRSRAPSLGEHTDEVLREYGLSDAELTELRAAHAIA